MVPELLDFAKDLVHTAGVLAHHQPFQLHDVVAAGAIAIFADTVDSLVGVESNETAASGGHGHADIGDPQL